MSSNYTLNYWVALAVFVAHILGNFSVARPNPALEAMLRKYTFTPPFWVFGIWLVIWGLQGVLFYKTAGSSFWTNSLTVLFVLVCLGNVGSQIAGAYNLPGAVYLLCLAVMFGASLLFMEHAAAAVPAFPIVKPATQLYVGWASLALVVGTGAVLVAERELISNGAYSRIGYVLLAVVPALIWTLWLQERADYRVVSIPYFLVLFAFALRLLMK